MKALRRPRWSNINRPWQTQPPWPSKGSALALFRPERVVATHVPAAGGPRTAPAVVFTRQCGRNAPSWTADGSSGSSFRCRLSCSCGTKATTTAPLWPPVAAAEAFGSDGQTKCKCSCSRCRSPWCVQQKNHTFCRFSSIASCSRITFLIFPIQLDFFTYY